MRTRTLSKTLAGAGVLALAGLLLPSLTGPSATAAAATRHRFVPPPPAKVTSSSAGATGKDFKAVIHHWSVKVGPGRKTTCSVLGELFVPKGAKHDPAILTTNGFGGSYTDQVALAELAVRYGYVVLTYSGLGFGGSGCNIELDSRAYDGEAASQLVSYLGTLKAVKKDGKDSPVVGMVGGSYGGEVQFAAAAIDPRIKAIVPMITWNDLAYSLAPNNSSASFKWEKAAPGVLKWEWTSLFFGDGLAEPYENPTATPFPPSSCPGFDASVCQAYLQSVSAGYPTPSVVSLLEKDSVVSYYKHVRAATLLMQGEDDSLFDIAEAVANYKDLKSIGDHVKLVLQSWGHSDSTPAPGELSYTSVAHGYETRLILDWFAKYLKHKKVATGPAVEYFRPWIKYSAKASAEKAYGTAPSWPVGRVLPLYLSGSGSLVTLKKNIASGTATFANPPDAQPASYSETSGVQDESPFSSIPPTDPPGTYASFESAPLPAKLDSVGIPLLHVALAGAAASSASPATEAVVFAKIYDVSPSGSLTLVNRLVSPVRIKGGKEVTITLPGVVHRYAKGHRIELVIAATDQAYLGDRAPDALSVSVAKTAPGRNVLELPVVSPKHETSGGRRASRP